MKIIFEDEDGSRSEIEAALVSLSSGDQVLLKVSQRLTQEQRSRLADDWPRIFPDIKLAILDDDCEILVRRGAA